MYISPRRTSHISVSTANKTGEESVKHTARSNIESGWVSRRDSASSASIHGHTRTYVSALCNNSSINWAVNVRKWLKNERSVPVYFDNGRGFSGPRVQRQEMQIG